MLIYLKYLLSPIIITETTEDTTIKLLACHVILEVQALQYLLVYENSSFATSNCNAFVFFSTFAYTFHLPTKVQQTEVDLDNASSFHIKGYFASILHLLSL